MFSRLYAMSPAYWHSHYWDSLGAIPYIVLRDGCRLEAGSARAFIDLGGIHCSVLNVTGSLHARSRRHSGSQPARSRTDKRIISEFVSQFNPEAETSFIPS